MKEVKPHKYEELRTLFNGIFKYAMTQKEICKNSLTIAFSYAFKGFEVKSIIHENSGEIYAVSNILTEREKYHKLRIYTNAKGQYVRLYGRIFYLENLIKL